MKTLLKLAPAIGLILAGAAPGVAEEGLEGKFRAGESTSIRAGDTRVGDFYFAGQNLDVQGRIEGDVFGWAFATVITGEVTGDAVLAGYTVEIAGDIGDSVRVWGYSTIVTGTIDGDLIVFSGVVNVHPSAHVTGDLVAYGGTAIIDGTIDGNVVFGGGEASLGATVGKDVDIVEVDKLRVNSSARVAGDLEYTARTELEQDVSSQVGGEVRFVKRKEEKKDDGPAFTLRGFLWWAWQMLASMVAGFVAVGIFGRYIPATQAAIPREGFLGGLIGFFAMIVVPVAALVAMVLIITLPLGLVTLFVFFPLIYLAKLPTALWLGRMVLTRSGGSEPSPYAAVAVGVLGLYTMFAIPFWIGTILWWAATAIGFGSIILAARHRQQAQTA